tara:strand:+ start:596 stop:808 length:213 start_codon:yes stop_codon:yes gene_type:complete
LAKRYLDHFLFTLLIQSFSVALFAFAFSFVTNWLSCEEYIERKLLIQKYFEQKKPIKIYIYVSLLCTGLN